MIHVQRMTLQANTKYYAINGIIIPMAFYYMDVTVHTPDRGDREIKVPVRMNPHVARESYLRGVDYKTYIPVLSCVPDENEGFHIDLGYVDVNSRYLDMHHQKRSYLAYLGSLPDVAESDVRDLRYVTPIDVYQVQLPEHAPRHVRVYGATVRTDYLRTSALDKIDDEMWEALRTVDHPKGIPWSRFLDEATSGRFTAHDDLSNCLEDFDHEYMPEHIFKRIRIAQYDKRRG